MILGVTGFFCSGKDTLAAYLEKKSFYHVSLSDIIREEIRRRGRRVSLRATIEVGNELRRQYGPQILAQRALARLDQYKNYVVSSIRHPAEVEMLRSRRDFALIFVDAPLRVRYQRSRGRARKGDFTTFEEFKQAEQEQRGGKDPTGQQLEPCRALADLRIRNNSTLESFHAKIDRTLRDIILNHMPPRPSWDEYFMNMAAVAATRSNCIKRHVGAIIVKDRQIVSTGYNGTPKGIKNCNEGGCPRCWAFADSGSRLDECLCVHAEENAIVQAACNGISIKGSDLYTTFCPCSYCAKSIINAGIAKVVYREQYGMDDVTRRLFAEAGVELVFLNTEKA
jgi:dCMP deaminase